MLLIFTLMVAIMSSSIFNLTWCLITALSCSLHVEIRRSLAAGKPEGSESMAVGAAASSHANCTHFPPHGWLALDLKFCPNELLSPPTSDSGRKGKGKNIHTRALVSLGGLCICLSQVGSSILQSNDYYRSYSCLSPHIWVQHIAHRR